MPAPRASPTGLPSPTSVYCLLPRERQWLSSSGPALSWTGHPKPLPTQPGAGITSTHPTTCPQSPSEDNCYLAHLDPRPPCLCHTTEDKNTGRGLDQIQVFAPSFLYFHNDTRSPEATV